MSSTGPVGANSSAGTAYAKRPMGVAGADVDARSKLYLGKNGTAVSSKGSMNGVKYDPTSENVSVQKYFMTAMSSSRFTDRFQDMRFEPAFVSDEIPMLGDSTLFLPPFLSAPSTDNNQGNIATMYNRCMGNGFADDKWATDCTITAKAVQQREAAGSKTCNAACAGAK